MLDADMEAVATRCNECGAVVTPIPALGTRWVLAVDHRPGCSEFIADEDLPSVVVQPPLDF